MGKTKFSLSDAVWSGNFQFSIIRPLGIKKKLQPDNMAVGRRLVRRFLEGVVSLSHGFFVIRFKVKSP